MILISHPRAGTEWFFDCIRPNDFVRWEIFGRALYNKHERPLIPSLHMTVDQKAQVIASNIGSHKIMLGPLLEEASPNHFVLDHLRERDDVYLLRRRNVRSAFLSLQIAAYNNFNFHGDNRTITKSFAIKRDAIDRWHYGMHEVFNEDHGFNYQEQFWYEDLLAGMLPQTLNFNPNRTQRPRRNSLQYQHLITNLDEVIHWMDELGTPGNLET